MCMASFFAEPREELCLDWTMRTKCRKMCGKKYEKKSYLPAQITVIL